MGSLFKPKFKTLLVLIGFILTPLLSYQQNNSGDKNLLKDFRHQIEDIYKYDDLLVNGHLYRPIAMNVKGSPYLIKSSVWKNGSIYIKGREFPNQRLAYNIATDEFAASILFPDGTNKNIVLDKRFIDSLYIDTHFFINVSPFTKNKTDAIYEQVYSGHFKALLSHSTEYIPEITSATPNGYYTKTITNLFILEDGEFVRISNRKSLLKYFESHRKEIARYIRLNRISLKSAQKHELFNLFKYCDGISN